MRSPCVHGRGVDTCDDKGFQCICYQFYYGEKCENLIQGIIFVFCESKNLDGSTFNFCHLGLLKICPLVKRNVGNIIPRSFAIYKATQCILGCSEGSIVLMQDCRIKLESSILRIWKVHSLLLTSFLLVNSISIGNIFQTLKSLAMKQSRTIKT